MNRIHMDMYTCPLPLAPPPPPAPSRPQAVTEHRSELPASHGRLPLAVCPTQGAVFDSALLSQFASPWSTVFDTLKSCPACTCVCLWTLHVLFLCRFLTGLFTIAFLYNSFYFSPVNSLPPSSLFALSSPILHSQ